MAYLKIIIILIVLFFGHLVFDAAWEIVRPKGIQAIAISETRQEENRISRATKQAFHDGNFAALEQLYTENRHRLLADGMPALEYFYAGLDSFDDNALEARFLAWQKAQPQSPAPFIALARLPYLQAINLLSEIDADDFGAINAGDLSEENRARFTSLLQQSLQQMNSIRANAHSDPFWHVTRINVIGLLSDYSPALLAAASDAMNEHPDHIPVYLAGFTYVQPRYGGSVTAMRDFAEQAAKAAGNDGDMIYARLQASLTRPQAPYRYSLFIATYADWARIRNGYEEIIDRWPDAINRNQLAMMACTEGDRETASLQLREIGDRPLDEVWDKPIARFVRCKSWSGIEQAKELDIPIPEAPGSREYTLQTTAGMYLQHDWAGLEERHNSYFTGDSRFPDGAAQLDIYYAALSSVTSSNMIGGPAYWENQHSAVEAWQKAYPGSYLPQLMQASLYFNEAYMLLGNRDFHGLTNALRPEAQENMKQLVTEARSALENAPAAARKDPFWHMLMLNVARSENLPTPEMQELALEGIRQRPQSDFYMQAIDVMNERQGKGMAPFVELLARTAWQAGGADGPALYARIYEWAYRQYFHEHMFENSRAVWADLREGFRSLTTTYPHPWHDNSFAALACLARDPATARSILKDWKFHPVYSAWKGGEQAYRTCADWVSN